MFRVAEFEKRSGWIWGGVGALWMFGVTRVLEPGLLALLAGFGGAFATMFLANLLRKAPELR